MSNLEISLSAERYGGKKRSDLKDSDFVIPSERKFPVMSSKDVKDAVSNFGRYKGSMTYEEFKKKLVSLVKRKGLQSSLPKTIKEQFKIKASIIIPDKIKNILASKTNDKNTLEKLETAFKICAEYCLENGTINNCQRSLAQANIFLLTKNEKLLVEPISQFSAEDLAKATVELISNKAFSEELLAKVEIEIEEDDTEEDDMEDDTEDECECEKPEMSDDEETCSKCGKKMESKN